MRDYLRTHKGVADEYGQLKEKLADAYPYDIEKYCDGKEAFVKSMERKALLWKQSALEEYFAGTLDAAVWGAELADYLSKGAIPPHLPESNEQNIIVIEAFLEAVKRYAYKRL